MALRFSCDFSPVVLSIIHLWQPPVTAISYVPAAFLLYTPATHYTSVCAQQRQGWHQNNEHISINHVIAHRTCVKSCHASTATLTVTYHAIHCSSGVWSSILFNFNAFQVWPTTINTPMQASARCANSLVIMCQPVSFSELPRSS